MPGSRMRTAARVIRHQSDRQPPHTLSIQTSCDESRSHRRVVQARVVNRVAPAAQHQLLQTVDPSSIPVLRRLKIPCLSRRTCPSWRHQSMASQSRPMSSGPFTSMPPSPSRTLLPSSVPNLSFGSGAHSSQLPRGSWERLQRKIARSLAAPQCADCGCGATIVMARSKDTRQAQQASEPEFL
jgi:hypothetical protein